MFMKSILLLRHINQQNLSPGDDFIHSIGVMFQLNSGPLGRQWCHLQFILSCWGDCCSCLDTLTLSVHYIRFYRKSQNNARIPEEESDRRRIGGMEKYNYLRGWDCTSAMATTVRVYQIMLIALIQQIFWRFYLLNPWCFTYNLIVDILN